MALNKPTEQEIEEMISWCADAEDNGSHFRGMTYEQGIRAAIEWMLGEGEKPNE
jgi:hypothetical protein